MRLLCIDTETTGVDVFNDRVVTLFAGVMDNGVFVDTLDVILNPGVDIPEEASNVHGITNQIAHRVGIYPGIGLLQLKSFLDQYSSEVDAAVIMNAPFDITLLVEEFSRHGLGELPLPSLILDPLVIDRAKDKYRKGSRKLVDMANHYMVPVDVDSAHNASYDCYLAGNVTLKLIERYGIPTMDDQARWYREWAINFEKYLRSKGNADKIDTNWPLRLKENTN